MKNKFLIVDDDPLVCRATARLVEHVAGRPVECCGSGAEALGLFAADPAAFVCVITDYEMPGMNGLELGRRLRALAPGVRMLLMTGRPGVLNGTDVTQPGFDCVLAKPFDLARMEEALRPVLPVLNDSPSPRRGHPAGGAMFSGPCGIPLAVM